MRALVLTILCASTAAHAAPNDELWIGPTFRSLASSSANAVTDKDLNGGELSYARDLGDTFGIAVMPKLAVWGVAAYRWASTDGTMFQSLATEVETDELSLGARARYALHRHLVLNGRVDFGTARTQLALTDSAGNRNADSRWAGVAASSVALDLMAIARSRFSLGMRVEFGYVAATAPEMQARSQEGDDGTIMLPVNQVSFGHLDLGGRYWSIGWFGQF